MSHFQMMFPFPVRRPVSQKGNNNCALALYFERDQDIKVCWSISVNKISRNSITQLGLNHYLLTVIQNSTIEHRYPWCTDTRNITPSVAVRILHEGSIFNPDFIIPAIKSFTSKMP